MQIVEPLLGTRAEVHVTADLDTTAAQAEQLIITEVRRLEELFTVFDSTSALNEFRRTGSTSVTELIQVGELATRWHEISSGAFDPRLQGFIELWDDAEAKGVVPAAWELEDVAAKRELIGCRFDNLNAIAKGWIAQKALHSIAIDATGSRAAWLSLGGDIAHRGSDSVAVGIEDPHRPYDNVAPLATIKISNEAVATSGGARRWWTIDGQRYPKILDPRTGQPVDHVASATIVASDAEVADVLATIATVADPAQTLDLVASAGAECLLVHADRSRTCTSDRFVFR